MTTSSTGVRFDGIDGVRAFAVLAVIAAHSHVFWMHGGGVGVDIFFAISGFLITYLLLGEHARFGRIALGKFWLRRILRLLPALVVLVALVDLAVIVIEQVRPDPYLEQTVPATVSVLFYFSNWMIVGTNSAWLGWFGPLWSLSVEEQFYLLWPLILVAVMALTRGRLRVLAGIAAVVAVAAVVARFIDFDGSNVYRTFGTDFRVDMLLAGVLLAIAFRAGLNEVIRKAATILVAPAVLYLLVVSILVPEFGVPGTEDATRIYYTWGLPLVALSTVSILGFLVTHQESRFTRFLSLRPIAYTGRVSYGIYLWHYPVIMALGMVPHGNSTTLFIAATVLTYLVAGLSWRFVERPLQARFHDRLKPSAPRLTVDRSIATD